MATASEADVLHRTGVQASERGEHQAALAALSRAIALDPSQCWYHNDLGNALQRMGRIPDSLLCYQEALRLEPGCAEAYNNQGSAYLRLERRQEAIASFLKASELKPDYPDPYNNLGNVLQAQGHLMDAASCYREALALRPDFAEAWHNLGKVFEVGRSLEDALSCYEEALRIRPRFAEAHISRAMTWLLMGHFEQGWEEYEWRWQGNELPRREFAQPRWDGSRLDGSRILLYAEQGLGDTLQFLRFVPMVREAGGRVIVECQARLAPLVETLPGIEAVIAAGAPLPPFDVQAPLLSLPRIFRTTLETIPTPARFQVDGGRLTAMKRRLGRARRKIGLVWAGNPVHRDNPYRDRSVRLASFAPLAQVSGLALFSLQRGPEAAQLSSAPPGLKISNLEAESTQIMDTAAAIMNLDLVISVDSMAPHLAGSLGKPVWVLLPFASEWRWLLEREDSPWYPSVRLFRQPRPGDWAEVMKRILEALDAPR